MSNKPLAKDYVARANKRLVALEALYKVQAWADVVHGAQEIVELSLVGLLRHFSIEVPRIHDVSGILGTEAAKFPASVQENLPRYMSISKTLRRDRELAFYGNEDLIPSEFYSRTDADFAKDSAQWIAKSLLEII